MALALALPWPALARATIVASIHPYASLLRQIAGPDADVIQILPSGASPHTYDPAPSDARAIARADLVVMNGGVDAWLSRLVAAVNPSAASFVATQAVTYVPIRGNEAAPGTADATTNPHIWLDPSLMAQAVPLMAAAVAGVDPGHAAAYLARGRALATELAALDRDLAASLAPVAGRPFVPFHDGWPYFARHFRLDVVTTLEPFPGREPSARYLTRAIAAIRASGAVAIFSERQLDARPAQVVADSAGIRLYLLDPLGTDDQTYQDVLRAAAATVLAALSR